MSSQQIRGPATITIVKDDAPASVAAPVAQTETAATAQPTQRAAGTRQRQLAPGIFSPVPTFFHPQTEEIDEATLARHVVRLASAGVGSVVAGSNGEAVHITSTERVAIVKAARAALDQAGFENSPLIAGAGAGSTFETIQNTKEVAAAGADYALVITQSFYSANFKAHPHSIIEFYKEVATASPVPILIYNYPAVTGIDLTSEQLLELAKHPNIVGCKLTCANVGKLVRVACVTAHQSFVASGRHGFYLFGGYSDFLLPGLLARSSGAITGLANIAPRVVKKLFDLGVSSITTCDAQELRAAQALQDVVARADAVLAAGGIGATKAILQGHFGYGGVPRRPLLPFTDHKALSAMEHGLKEILELEISLS